MKPLFKPDEKPHAITVAAGAALLADIFAHGLIGHSVTVTHTERIKAAFALAKEFVAEAEREHEEAAKIAAAGAIPPGKA